MRSAPLERLSRFADFSSCPDCHTDFDFRFGTFTQEEVQRWQCNGQDWQINDEWMFLAQRKADMHREKGTIQVVGGLGWGGWWTMGGEEVGKVWVGRDILPLLWVPLTTVFMQIVTHDPCVAAPIIFDHHTLVLLRSCQACTHVRAHTASETNFTESWFSSGVLVWM